MLKKLCSLLLVLALLCPMLSVSAVAGEVVIEPMAMVESEIQPLWDYTSNYAVGMSFDNGRAYCVASVKGYSSLANKVEITMTLQKKTLFWWSKVETWSISVNDCYAALDKNTAIGSGTYRVKAEFVVYSGSETEEITGYSQEGTY